MRLGFLLLTIGLPASAWAHGSQTGYLELRESVPGHAVLRVQATGMEQLSPEIEGCHTQRAAEGLFSIECPGGLAGRRLDVSGLGGVLPELATWAELAGGIRAQGLLSVGQPAWVLPATGVSAISRAYLGLGLRHILSGPDHLLFLLLLVVALRRPGAVLWAETGFTLSHSVALSATALGLLRVSPAPVEACIALSLLFLALEVNPGGAPLPVRPGATMALAFGLVHGLGFAGGLQQAGLPPVGAAWALLGFGLGIEVGQVAVLALALLVYLGVREAWRVRFTWAGTYVAGMLACGWLLQRVGVCLSGPARGWGG